MHVIIYIIYHDRRQDKFCYFTPFMVYLRFYPKGSTPNLAQVFLMCCYLSIELLSDGGYRQYEYHLVTGK